MAVPSPGVEVAVYRWLNERLTVAIVFARGYSIGKPGLRNYALHVKGNNWPWTWIRFVELSSSGKALTTAWSQHGTGLCYWLAAPRIHTAHLGSGSGSGCLFHNSSRSAVACYQLVLFILPPALMYIWGHFPVGTPHFLDNCVQVSDGFGVMLKNPEVVLNIFLHFRFCWRKTSPERSASTAVLVRWWAVS